jgi:hypothetical protein
MTQRRSPRTPGAGSLRGVIRCAALLCAAQTVVVGQVAAQSTPADRAALFDYILAKTLERESFSPVKNRTLGLDVEREMLRFRDELIAADTEEEFYYALAKISNARKDRHLRINLVEGGISLRHMAGVEQANYPVPGSPVLHAPIRFAADYGTPGAYFVFVSDYAEDIRESSGSEAPGIGDKLIAINGRDFADYVAEIEPYHRYSTVNGFWWQLATWIPQRSHQFPPEFYRASLELILERKSGERYSLALPYLPPAEIDWVGHGERQYPSFRHVSSSESFDLYLSRERRVVLLQWHGFRDDLVTAVDRLMEYAVDQDILDYAVVVDATRSGGGSLGAYAVRRLSPRPFKTTFGNLRVSDITQPFIDELLRGIRRGDRGGLPAELDDGTWLSEWLEGDVAKAIEAGQRYTNNVPFKLAHLPEYSDGIIDPAELHFRGPLVCWFSPYGGSHLDQFASIIVDNELAHTLGMSPGGYSNTWEWEEVLVFPRSQEPVVEFMWSIGHTIRPNGEVLEGNPALVDEFVPLTRDNYLSYYDELMARTFQHLGIR